MSCRRFFISVLLVLYEWARDRKAGAGRARNAAALCLLPFLFLIPWAVMNWRLSGRFVLFEDGRADVNIITGVLGLVRTMGIGDYRGMVVPADQSILLWAAGEILRHPLRYLAAFFARLGYAASLHPLLALASAASIWITRKREDCRQLALLAAYFFAIHCLMPVHENYFVPAWPLLAVLASGLLASWTRPASKRLKAVSASTVYAIFALLLSAQACVLALVLAYPARAGDPRALERELARYPNNPWLWSQRGMGRLRAGRAKEAVGDLARAFALDPLKDRQINYAWALLARGGPATRIWERWKPGGFGMIIDLRERVLQAIYLALEGRRTEAVAAMENVRKYKCASNECTDSALAGATPLPQIILEIISSWPAGKRPAILNFFSGIPGFGFMRENIFVDAWLDAVRLNFAAGDRRSALERLAIVESLRLDPMKIRKLALVYWDIGSYSRSLAILKRTDIGGPGDADMLLDMAVRAARSNQRRAALESLAFAESLSMDPARMRRLILAYRNLGEPRSALRVRCRLEDHGGLWLDQAESAASAGDRNSALAYLARARDLGLAEEESRRLALLYQGLREYASALEVADRRIRARPDDAQWRNDRGVLHALRGERDAAISDWNSAIELNADLMAPYLSLGSLYASLNRRKEALDLYQKAVLRRHVKKGDEGILRQILGERKKLLSAPSVRLQ